MLSDPNKRARYDSFGHISAEGIFTDVDFESGFGDIFGNLFEEVFNAGGAEKSRKGRDLKYSLDLTFDESIEGCEKELKIPSRERCRECGGSGAARGGEVICTSCGGRGELRYSQGLFAIKRACPTCGGTGKSITKAYASAAGGKGTSPRTSGKVKVPAGISDGVRLRMRGEGDSGYLEGPSGDLYIEIHVEEHPLFRREEQDLYCTVPDPIRSGRYGG